MTPPEPLDNSLPLRLPNLKRDWIRKHLITEKVHTNVKVKLIATVSIALLHIKCTKVIIILKISNWPKTETVVTTTTTTEIK